MARQTGFEIFLGIDQTGAVLPGSAGTRAKPLPWAAVFAEGDRARLVLPQEALGRLHLGPLRKALHLTPRNRMAVLVDCVLGLPPGRLRWPDVLNELTHVTEPFGRSSAEAFFESLLARHSLSAGTIPTRLCEEQAGANSVFRSRPFQKNIQTGTYRLWRDLASDADFPQWSVWPFSPEPQSPALFEGYPSLLWRQLARLPSRQPDRLAAWLKHVKIRFSSSDEQCFCTDPDLADAVMLAAGGWVLDREGQLTEPRPNFFASAAYRNRARVEGWIAGLASQPDESEPTA